MIRYFIAVLIVKIIAINSHGQSVSLNIDGSTADQSSMLDVKSATKGILIPRMTEVERTAISSPATSLMIYQTDAASGYYYNAGTPAVPAWQKISTDKTTVAFSSNYTLAGQAVPASSYGKVQFNVEDYDESNNFVPGATSEFTAPSAGIYQFTSVVTITGASNSRYDISFFVNGVQKKNSLYISPASLVTLSLTADLKLAINDKVDVRVNGIGGSPGTVVGGSAPWVYFNGYKVN